jgi:hypothetical protein
MTLDWLKIMITALGFGLAGLLYFPQFRTVARRHSTLIVFAIMLVILPWLPVSRLAFGGASIDLYRQEAIKIDNLSQKEFAAYTHSMRITLGQLETQIKLLKPGSSSPAQRSETEKTLARLANEAKRAHDRYVLAAQATQAARRHLIIISGGSTLEAPTEDTGTAPCLCGPDGDWTDAIDVSHGFTDVGLGDGGGKPVVSAYPKVYHKPS